MGHLPAILLAYDVSSSCVGWAEFRDGKPERFGKFVPEGVTHQEKLAHLARTLEGAIGATPVGARTDVIFEEPYLGRNRHAYVLMLYHGAALATAVNLLGTEHVHVMGPRAVKRALALPKKASYEQRKRQAVREANRLFGLHLRYKPRDPRKTVSDDDTADALLLGQAFLGGGNADG